MEKKDRKEFDAVLFEGTESAMIARDPQFKEMQELREMMMRGGDNTDG
jgi:hypothetical protein